MAGRLRSLLLEPQDNRPEGVLRLLDMLFAPDPRSLEGRGFTRTDTGLQAPLPDRNKRTFADLENLIAEGIARRKRFPIQSVVSPDFKPIPPVGRQ